MKKFFLYSVNRLRLACLTATLALTAPLASAQDDLGTQVLDSSKEALRGLLDSLVSLLQVVMGLGALVVLAIVIFKIFKGDREAAEKLAWWVAGLTVGFALLTVVKNIVSGIA